MRTALNAAPPRILAALFVVYLAAPAVLPSHQVRAEFPPVTAATLDGRTLTGPIQSLTADALVVATAAGAETVSVSELLAVAPTTPPAAVEDPSPSTVELQDGSILAIANYVAAAGTAKFTFAGKPIELRTRAIAAVHFQTPTPAIEAQWQTIRADTKIAGDLVLIRKGEAVDNVEGVITSVDAENVELELDGSKIPVKRSRVDGLIYFHRQTGESADPLVVVYLANETQLAVRALSSTADGLDVETLSGLKASLPWKEIRRLDFSAGKLQYLNVALGATDGALLPDDEKVTEFLQLKTPFAAVREFYRPRSNSWGVRRPLKLQGEIYDRGLALRSRTELTYRVRGKYRRFQATAGVDDSVAGQSNDLRLTITGDGRTLWDELIRGTDPPRKLDLNIEGVSRLDIKVDYGDDGLDSADLLNLCEARVTK